MYTDEGLKHFLRHHPMMCVSLYHKDTPTIDAKSMIDSLALTLEHSVDS